MIVIDTHVLIWAVQGSDKLGRQAAATIQQNADNGTCLIPAICTWEVAHVDRRGKVVLSGGARQWLDAVLASLAFRLVPLDPRIACLAVNMDWAHKDPADRLIVATARELECPLMTADETILAHAAAGHLKAIDARL